ncbi:putative serine protease protein [Lasiodiplodia theobromae]|uniref:Aqualysin-1 n=1 Tax=Lasiodiplodia theobromae TaxID=45133 RepID=A0A5N5DA24_9PEZI|nr:Serine protease protein [Lasiodiplodia theobromae]KAB2574152.1 Aqualysin-1 [Lasiodiplodia theobromae]KAF4540739.1 Serine protease protein [Lasiodiplodia theobromae]KAF9634769.1 putative serine protease protein [Lasiodiplodia theobromae]
MKTTLLIALQAAFAAVLAAPAANRQRRDTKEFDIVTTPEVDVAALLAEIELNADMDDVFATFNNTQFKGFSGALTQQEADFLNAKDEVLTVEPVVPIHALATRGSAPWGLQRVSQSSRVSGSASSRSFTYTYDDTALGRGVDVYVVDTGIYTAHSEFGGRARTGWSYYSSTSDGNGHGTHCAGTIAGSTVGVASNANLIAVKVLDSSGQGTSTGLLAGLDYVASTHNTRKSQSGFIASVASMSLGFEGRATAVETAVRNLAAAGVHTVVAAGNSNTNACTQSPSAVGGTGSSTVLSIGASTIGDAVASFSNTGPCVDVFAPGQDVISASNSGASTYRSLSGTSMATPHVAGLVAYFAVGNANLRQSPAAMKSFVKSGAISGVLTRNSGYVSGGDLVLVNNGA